ncbi:MAG: hypothetical protein Q8O98_00115 [bacterium]|nr:hypothetical protein [bacterium]
MPSLSYFTTKKFVPGDFLRVPIKNSLVTGIVTRVHDASESKTELKRSNWSLKKVSGERGKELNARLPEPFMRACQKTATYYAASLGTVLRAVIPKFVLEKPELLFDKRQPTPPAETSPVKSEPLVIQTESDERLNEYKSIIRENLAKRKSIMFIAPSEREAYAAFEFLSAGIADYAHLFTANQKIRQLEETLKRARNSERPVLFVTTPFGASFDRKDLDTIILERENSRSYRTLSRPYMNLKVFFEFLTHESKKRLILGDSTLSLETLAKERNGEYKELIPLKWRLTSRAHTMLVDLKAEQHRSREFSILSPEIKELITLALKEDGKIFLFGLRKGLAPVTLCGDCGALLACKNCGAPVVLHVTGESRIYACHSCGARRESSTTCDYCRSWKLVPLGVGTSRIAEEVKTLLPGSRVYILDKDHAATEARAKKIVKDWSERGGILIGTELALFHLDTVAYVGLVSADSLFSVPDFSINERIFYLVSRLREIALRELVVQTRNIGKQILTWATQGNILEFFRTEMAEREELLYPPFSIFIKITALSREPEKSLSLIQSQFAKWNPDTVRESLIIRLPREKWPDTDLVEELALLGSEFSIKVDPESIL